MSFVDTVTETFDTHVVPNFNQYGVPFIVKYQVSIWIGFITLLVTAKNYDPSFIGFFIGIIVTALLVGLHFVAKLEGSSPAEDTTHGKIVKVKPSLLLLFSILVLSAFATHPSVATYEGLAFSAIFLTAFRFTSQIEGANND